MAASSPKFVCDKCHTSLAVPILPPGAKIEGPCPRCGNHLVFTGPTTEPVTSAVFAPSSTAPAAAPAAPRNPALDLYGPPKGAASSKPAAAKMTNFTLKNVKLVEMISITAIAILALAIGWAAWTKFRPVPPAKVISSTQPA